MMDIITAHPLLSIAAAVILTILIFIIVTRLFYKIKNTRIKVKETKEIKKDLMIWKRIAHLARGGSESDNAKNSIVQSNIQIINAAFEKLKNLLKSDFKSIYDVPWYIALGEPYAGKSSLIENSMQDMVATEQDELEKDGSQKSALLKFWVGSSAVVADVSGKVFFDRWLEGSGAEWTTIIKNIRKKHKNNTLSGIILTIPADSLIADDEALTKRKAVLMKTELNRMVNMFGMHLPCYVVITKSDMLPGFREYFANIDDNVRKAPLGWKSSKPYYEDYEFSSFWIEFINNLRKGRNSLLLNSDVFYTKSENGRFDTASNIFLFSESVNDLAGNIEIYMKTIFGSAKVSHFQPSLALDGLYFTSSGDSGYTLNKFFAKMQNKKIDDAPIAEEAVNKKGFFVSDLFSRNIFVNKNAAFYTSKEVIRRNIPHYLALGTMGALSLLWILSTIFNNDKISEKISNNISFYKETADIFANKSINQAYLISLDKNGNPVYNGEDGMPNDQLLYRQSYYITALKDVQTKWNAPFGFYASSLLKYGTINMDYHNRLYLFELIHSRLVTFPLIRTIETLMINDKDTPFTLAKRDVFFSLLHFMDENKHYSMEEERQKVEIMIKYLFPDMHDEIVKLLTAKNYYSKRDYQAVNESIIIHKSYFQAIQSGMQSMLDGWSNGSIYPDSEYNTERNLIYAVNTVENMVNNTVNFKADDDGFSNIDILTNYARLWTQIYNNIVKNVMIINNSLQQIKDNNPDALKEHSDKTFIPMLALSYANHIKLFEEDFSAITSYNNRTDIDKKIVLRDFVDSVQISTVKENAVTNLENEFNRMQTAVTKNLNKLFATVEIDKTVLTHYNLLLALYNSAYNRPVNKIDANIDIAPIISQYNKNVKHNYSLLTKYEEVLQGNDDFAKLIPFLKLMHSHTYQYNNIVFVKDMVNHFPETELDLMVKVSLNYGENMSVPFPAAKYIKLMYKTEYNTKAADEYINPFWNSINEIYLSIPKDDVNYLSYYLSNNYEYARLYNMMNNYTAAYIRYWGTFGDSIIPAVYNYGAFHNFISGLQPYIVNNEIYNVYLTSNKIINMLPENIIPQTLNRDKVNYSKAIEVKLNGIDPAYNDMCNTLIANWQALPQAAVNANKTFSSMSEQIIKQKYLALSIDNDKFVNIPWWRKLFEKGEYLVKHDAAFGAVNLIKQYQNQFSRFPLYADGNAADSLEMTELFDLKYILNDFGWIADNATSSDEIIAIKAPLKLSGLVKDEEQVKQWGKDVLSIINSLTATPIPLEWTMFVPNEIKQLEMAKNTGINSALPLFRYIEFTADNDTKKYKKFYTASDNDAKLQVAKDNAIAGDFKFLFYSHSESEQPQSQCAVNGKWSIIKLYLDKNTVKESDTVYYVPVYVLDERGLVYIYYLGVEFNKPVPDGKTWPNKYNWPDFS